MAFFNTTVLLFSFFIFASEFSQAQERPLEAYSSRPDILSLKGKAHSLGRPWETAKRAQLELTALLVNMYPRHSLYFIARDAEFIYDQTKLIFKKFPQRRERIHLINVSMKNRFSPHILKYLEQEGISERALEDGKKIIFIDIGFAGTIPKTIKSLFPQKYHKQMQSHFVLSQNESIPSTKSFLTWFDQMAHHIHQQYMKKDISLYEETTHYTNQSTTFAEIHGHWEAMSPATPNSSSILIGRTPYPSKKTRAQMKMEDLISFSKSEEAKEIYNKRSRIWKNLYDLSKEERLPLFNYLKELVSTGDYRKEALVRDFIELTSLNDIGHHTPSLSIQDVGLQSPKIFFIINNEEILLNTYPQWEYILSNKNKEIENLFQKKDIKTIKKMVREIENMEFLDFLFAKIGQDDKEINQELIKNFITDESLHKKTLPLLASATFHQTKASQMKDLSMEFIDTAAKTQNSKALHLFALYTLPSNAFKTKFIKKFIELSLELNSPSLIQYVSRALQKKDIDTIAEIQDQITKASFQLQTPIPVLENISNALIYTSTKQKSKIVLKKLMETSSQIENKGLIEYITSFTMPFYKNDLPLVRQMIDIALETKNLSILDKLESLAPSLKNEMTKARKEIQWSTRGNGEKKCLRILNNITKSFYTKNR